MAVVLQEKTRLVVGEHVSKPSVIKKKNAVILYSMVKVKKKKRFCSRKVIFGHCSSSTHKIPKKQQHLPRRDGLVE